MCLAGILRPNADKRHVHESFFKLFPLGRILPNGNNILPLQTFCAGGMAVLLGSGVVQSQGPTPRWPALAILVHPMHKVRLPSRGFRAFLPEFGNFFLVRHSSPTPLAGEQRQDTGGPPGSKNLPRNIKDGQDRW